MASRYPLLFSERVPAAGTQCSPLLVLLHGWTMYRGHLFDLTTNFDPRLAMISPQGPIRLGPGAYRWFDFVRTVSSGPIIEDREEETSLEMLLAFLDTIVAERRPRAVYLLGHSQGGTMAISVLLKRPSLVTGCVNVNGRMLAKREAEAVRANVRAPIPFFCGHGRENDIVPLALGRWTRDRLIDFGGRVSWHEYPIGHEITPEVLADASVWLTGQLDELERTGAPRIARGHA